MKKLFLVLGIAAVCFCATSCKKQCECSTYVLGTVTSTVSHEIKSSEDCSQWVAFDEITKSGIKCEKK